MHVSRKDDASCSRRRIRPQTPVGSVIDVNHSSPHSTLARLAGVTALAGLAAVFTTVSIVVLASPVVQVLSQVATTLL
jgi:hypothetical protein